MSKPRLPKRQVKNKTKNSKFFDEVYKVVRRIPTGKVATYGQISKIVNSQFSISNSFPEKITPRIVGFALHANKDLKTPCHRVVDRNGRLAANYAFGGWSEQKMRLIAEGVKFKDELHVDLKISLWMPKR